MKALTLNFNNSPIHIDRDAWFNATDMANAFGKRPNDWLRLPETQEYIRALTKNDNTGLSRIIKTKKGKGGGTWFHRKLVVAFARWLSADFAVWCDERIEEILSGEWQQARNDSKAYYRMMTDTIQATRATLGRETTAHHYINEAKLINYALTGEYNSIDRDSVDKRTLSAIKSLESYNSVLIMMNMPREERKAKLWERGAKYRANLVEVAL